MENTNNYSFEINVYCQFPMLHFQVNNGYEVGLRASDIKPRLDRYLREVARDEGIESYFKNDTQSLDYKLFIETTYKYEYYIEKEKHYYFVGKIKDTNGVEIKHLYFCNCKLKFICFHEKLSNIINNNISNFFLLNNFGMMQSKGYGSFTVKEYENSLEEAQIKEIGKVLKDYTGNPVYCFNISNINDKQKYFSNISNKIKQYYGEVKKKYNFKVYETNLIDAKNLNDTLIYLYSEKRSKERIKGFFPANVKRTPTPIKFKVIGNYVFIYSLSVSKYILNKDLFKDLSNRDLPYPSKALAYFNGNVDMENLKVREVKLDE